MSDSATCPSEARAATQASALSELFEGIDLQHSSKTMVDGGGQEPLSGPLNPLVTPLLSDMYQLTMAYAYWNAGKHDDNAVFDLLFRKNPFGGEYTVFAGLEECVRFAAHFAFSDDDITYLRGVLPSCCEDAFFDYLKTINCSKIEIYAIAEGSVVFPRVPLIRVEGPLLVAQLLETTFLTLVNYASLVATNAARHRRVVGSSKALLEFGLRRAQGPDGGMSGSKYCYLGGFDATSNIAAGRKFGIPVRGTHSHAFVSSFMSFDEISERTLTYADGGRRCEDFVHLTMQFLSRIRDLPTLSNLFSETNQSELAAFISYGLAFPIAFQALVDTYDAVYAAVVIMACNRPDYLLRTMESVLKYHGAVATRFPLFISQDGNNAAVEAVARKHLEINFIQHLDFTVPNPRPAEHMLAYYKIASHYKWALSTLFSRYMRVIILEDDMEIAPDFFEYFEATGKLLDKDRSLMAVSSWNDNGQRQFVHDPEKLCRSDLFPGLGWMLNKNIWDELAPKWPDAFWDDWMRLKVNRNDRQFIRPEVCRTYNFGKHGSSSGQFFTDYLEPIKLNDVQVNWKAADLTYLHEPDYLRAFEADVNKAMPIPAVGAIEEAKRIEGDVRIEYSS